MKSLEEIIKPYKERLKKIDYRKVTSDNPNVYLFQKWAYRVGKNWYGFSLDSAPFLWGLIIDKFLEEIEKECPNFEIHQIKIKFGGLRFYVDLGKDIDMKKAWFVNTEINKLEDLLSSEYLIY